MKHARLLLTLLLLATAGLVAPRAHAQYIPILCNPTTACTQLGPNFSNTGDTYFSMVGKINGQMGQLFNSLGAGSGLAKNGTITSADIINLFSGSPSSSLCLGSQGGLVACSGGSGGNPGGSPGQLQGNCAGSFCGFTASGDAAINVTTGAVTVTKTSGTAFGTLATATTSTPVISLWSGCSGILYLGADGTCHIGVTSVSVASANGLSGSSSGGATPTLTLAPTFTGIAYSNGSGFAAAIAGNFPTLNQNSTGYSAGIAGGIANEIHYQTAANTTAFITAPVSASTYLEWNGSAFVWNTPAGGLSASGTPAQYQVGVFASGSAVAGIAPSSTVGEAFISNGTSANPGYSTSLAGVTSVNNTNIPGTQTLVYAGGPLGTPSGGVGTNLTGTAAALNIGGTAALATNIVGGLVDQIPYQTAANTTAFITAPGSSNIFLEWNGSAFVWAAPAGSGTVNSGTSGNFGYYSSTGTAISGITPVVAQGALNGVTPNVQSGTSYGFTTADRNLPFPGTIFTAGSAITATIQNDSTVAWMSGDELAPQQGGTGTVNLTAGSGVILCSTWSYELTGSACSGSGGLNVYPTYNIYEGQVWRHTTVANTWQLTYQTPYGTQQQFNLGIGQVAMPTGSIAAQSGSTPTCSAVTVASYYAKATSKAVLTPAVDSTTVAGYVPASPGAGNLDVTWYFSNSTQPGQLNIKLCNRSASAITAGALTMNYTILP